MTLDEIKMKVRDMVAQGLTPKTIILTPEDAKKLSLPTWTRQFLGMKVVIAQNFTESKIVPHNYETVTLNRRDTDANSNAN